MMTDDLSKQVLEAALQRLLETVKAPRALLLHAHDQVVLEQAIARVHAQLLGTPEPVLTVALAGGTGAGKSTLINALAGEVIAETGPLRPTTTKLHVYHHLDVPAGGLPADLTAEAVFIPHQHAALRSKVIVDTPDLDSFATHHRAATRALLKAAGLVLYVFSPQNYRDERTWSVLREEKHYSACAAVLNKIDLVAPEEVEIIVDDLRRAFARCGLQDIRLFRLVATAHVGPANGAVASSASVPDDLLALRGLLEHELQSSDITRLVRAQRVRVMAHLQTEINRLAPLRLLEQLEASTRLVSKRIEMATIRLYGALAEQLALAQEDHVKLVVLRQHERFGGPFRTWLALTDVLRFGLPRLARGVLGRIPDAEAPWAGLLTRRTSTVAADLLQDEARELQSLLYARGLSIDHWHTVTAQVDGHRLMADIVAALEARVAEATVASLSRGRGMAWLISTLGRLVPSAFVLIGLYVMGRDLLAGDYLGLPLLGHLFAMVILTFLALQGFASLFIPSGRRALGPEMGRQAIFEVLNRTIMHWMTSYRSDLEADLTGLHDPLTTVQAALNGGRTADELAPP